LPAAGYAIHDAPRYILRNPTNRTYPALHANRQQKKPQRLVWHTKCQLLDSSPNTHTTTWIPDFCVCVCCCVPLLLLHMDHTLICALLLNRRDQTTNRDSSIHRGISIHPLICNSACKQSTTK